MPRGDGTGPVGLGSMTGRGAGFCAGFNYPGSATSLGFRRGFRNFANAVGFGQNHFRLNSNSNFNQKNFLTKQAKFLEDQLKAINENLKGLDD